MPLLLSVLFLFISYSGSISQVSQQQTHRIALSFSHDNFTPTQQQLSIADGLGIRLYEVSDPATINQLQDPRYRFLIDTGPAFQVPGLLKEQLSEVSNRITQDVRQFQERAGDRIAAVSVLRYPFETYQGFYEIAESLSDSLAMNISVPLYYQSAFTPINFRPDGYSFVSYRTSSKQSYSSVYPVMHLVPADDQYSTYSRLNRIFDDLQTVEESITIIPARWFFTQLEEQPDLRYLFSDFTSGNPITLPLPEPSNDPPFTNWSVILLMLIWGSFALHFRYQPIYSQSMARYFSNHPFFVSDVMEHRLRNVLPGFILLLQHALLTGLFVFACVEVVVSSLGLEVIRHYFQPLMMLNGTMASLFLTGIAIAIVLQMVSVLWIYITNKKLTAFSQILNLYSWPLHLNLIVVTFLIVFSRVGFDEIWILILGALFILIWFFSFNIAAIDSSKFLDDGRTLFLLGTVGIHVLIAIGILVYILYTPAILEPILFAIELP